MHAFDGLSPARDSHTMRMDAMQEVKSMIRFKVVRASRLLLGLAIAVLVAVLCAIAFRHVFTGDDPARLTSASLVNNALIDEAGTRQVFASSDGPSLFADEEAPDAPAGIIDIELVGKASPSPSVPNAERKSVLIYHTHTHEAYQQVSDDPYEAVEAWRTEDAGHSVVRVGEALAVALERLGFEVVHDVTDHENDALSTAYTRSLKTLEGYDRGFDLYIDLHRDAYVEGMRKRYIGSDGVAYAQPMLLIGNGVGFDVKPYYEENLAFANALTDRVNREHPGLCKRVLVKDGRYNQHIGVFAILIEFGHNLNTLEEALNTAPVVARAIASLMLNDPDPSVEAFAAAHRDQ